MTSTNDIDLLRRPRPRVPSIPNEERAEDGGDTCRICRGEGTPEQPLYYPCKCSGSIKFVHQDCLMEWLSHSQKKYCELCKTPFRFTKLYDESMPEAVPWPLFLRQLLLHSFRALSRWLRYSLAISIWLCWLPWTIRQIWRGLFWIADGSWLSTQEMRAAVNEAYATHMANGSSSAASAMSTVSANVTVSPVEGTISILVPTLSAILGLLDPKIFLRAILRTLVSMAVNPIVVTEPMNWSGSTLLFTQISRPPSLLSDFQSIASATRSPILNNAFIDILEGQLICLAIITAFILVFLIREWVINQQPLLNIPDPDPADNAAPQRNDEPRRAARRRRRHRQLAGPNLDQADRPVLPVHPRIRRVATENNILVQNHVPEQDRPEPPQRAASLVPALQELEENARLLSEFSDMPADAAAATQNSPLESPPLQRGVFDDVGYIRRAIEERESASSPQAPRQPEQDVSGNAPDPEATGIELSGGHDSGEEPSDHSLNPLPLHVEMDSQQEVAASGGTANADEEWISDSGTEAIATPQASSNSSQEQGRVEVSSNSSRRASGQSQPHHDDDDYEDSGLQEEIGVPAVPTEPETLWTKISKWLWDTDEYVHGTTLAADTGESGNIVNVDGDNLLDPAPGHHAGLPALPPAAPGVAENPPANVQNGANANNPDAVDDAEDLEGIMELLGMEGPIAGMIQNIIFSVFLITLTLSASIWCPYIWGKITLLFVAHPFNVFVKAPLYVLSRTADIIVDIGLFLFGIFGVLINQITKLIKITLSLLAPTWSKRINPDILDKLSLSLSQKSGARLEKTFMRAVLGFRPDLPTFSVQAHHVLRVFTKTSAQVFNVIVSSVTSHVLEVSSTMNWHKLVTALKNFDSLAKALPGACLAYSRNLKAWHAQLQEDLRPLSFADPNEIDYTLVQWSSKEKIACIALGYALFGVVGYIYLKIAPYIYGLRKDEKVSGFFADTLRQAGGVMKVIVIIGIEMIVFPLYCGTMLDFALLPIFEGATVQTRLGFFGSTPLTALFVHWFIGTCYMFHFALFVSMCRKIMRKGVLYFIRDPDDPTFHPVRDVLERPVATQLGKIAFSAFVYGSLLVICLGGVIAGLDRVGNILPLRWGLPETPVMMPGDIVFFNFILPFILRKVDLSEKLSTVFEWWFRACAGGLRLSDFMFGIDDEKEKSPAPFLWRQFFNRILLLEDKSKEEAPGPVKDLKELAKNPERLLWLESGGVDTIEVELRVVAGPDLKYKNMHHFRLDDKAQALIEFEDIATAHLIKKEINEKEEEPDRPRLRAKSISDIQIDIRSARDTQVDTSAGTYVRAPAKDSVRIPKGTKVFVMVNEKNERTDGAQDADEGLHGKKNENFSRIYVPNHFKARVLTFVAMVWAFAALAGLSLSIGPLLLGRYVVTTFMNSEAQVNDLYAFTVGLHALCISAYLAHAVGSRWRRTADSFIRMLNNTRQLLPWVVKMAKWIAELVYLTTTLGVALPLALSFIAELYINIPILAHLIATEEPETASAQLTHFNAPVAGFASTPIINLIQTWTLGILYLRLVIRVIRTTPHEDSRPAVAIRSIARRGLLRPDVRLATRALVIPVFVICIALLGLPPLFARAMLMLYPHPVSDELRVHVYRYTYPAVLFAAMQLYVMLRLRQKVENWRVKIRDEVYLIGERLHNFPVQEDDKKKSAKKPRTSTVSDTAKGNGKERATSHRSTQTDLDDSSELLSDLMISQSATKKAGSSMPDQAAATENTLTETVSDDISPFGSASTKRRLSTREVPQDGFAGVDESDDLTSTLQPPSGAPESKSRLSSSSSSSPPPPSLQVPPSQQQDQDRAEPDANLEEHTTKEHSQTNIEKEMDDFREVTGLHEIPGVDGLGNVGRQVFGAGADDV